MHGFLEPISNSLTRCSIDEAFTGAAELSASDVSGSPDDLDSQEAPNLAVSDTAGVLVLPSSESASAATDDIRQSEEREGHADSDSRTASNIVPIKHVSTADHQDPSKATGNAQTDSSEGSLSIWELLRFTLPTLGVWIINPILRCAYTARQWQSLEKAL